MKYAVIRTGGKQYRVSEGMLLDVEKLPIEKDQKHTFADVLLYKDGESAVVGKPSVIGVSVLATVLEQKKGEKIRVSKFKAKARFRKVTGFRSQITTVRIDSIAQNGKTAIKEPKTPKKTSAQPKTK